MRGIEIPSLIPLRIGGEEEEDSLLSQKEIPPTSDSRLCLRP